MMLPQKSQTRKTSCLLAGVFLIGMAFPAWAVKPQPPLQLHLATAHQPNGNVKLTLHAKAFMDIPNAELLLHLPISTVLIEGAKRWEGPLAAGEEKTLTLSLRVPLSDAVLAEGIVTLPQGGSFTQYATLAIHHPTPPHTSSSPIRRKQGEDTILEFSGK